MKLSPKVHTAVQRLVALALMAVIAVGAAAIGTGRIGFQVTDGVSMEPTYHAGDLVLVARTGSYKVGQIVAYRAGPGRDTVLLHRIVGADAAGFVVKGDNNDSNDVFHPTSDQVIGRAVLRIPLVGAALGSPIGLGLFLVVALALIATTVKRPRRPRERGSRRPRAAREGQTVRGMRALRAAPAAVGVLLLVALAVSFAVPARPAAPAATTPTQTGALSYHGAVPISDTYPAGEVTTGDPVFVRLLTALDVSFRYTTDAPPSSVHGVARLDAVVTAASGWHRDFPLVPETPLVAGELDITGALDLAHIRALAERVATATGVGTGATLDVVVTASVSAGVDGGSPVDTASHLAFQLTPLALTLPTARPTATPHGPAVVSTVALAAASDGASPPSGELQRQIRLGLLAALLLCAGLTVVLWPGPPPLDQGAQHRFHAAADDVPVDGAVDGLTDAPIVEQLGRAAPADPQPALVGSAQTRTYDSY